MMSQNAAVHVADYRRQFHRSPLWSGALTALVAFFAAWPAHSGEYCVSCSGPEAQYRCAVEGQAAADPGARLLCITSLAKSGGHQSCTIDRKSAPPCPGELKVIAAPQGYAPDADAGPAAEAAPKGTETENEETNPAGSPPAGSAAAQPPRTGGDASGASAPEGGNDGQQQPAPGTKTWSDQSGPGGGGEQAIDETATGGNAADAVIKPIEKAGEAVGEAAKSAGTAVEKAGSTLGNAAKKTWKCLTTLFGDC